MDDVLTRKNGDFILQCGSHDFFMQIENVAKYSIINREKAFIELVEKSTIEEALPYFYGTVLTVILHMNMRFPIHASAVLSKDGLNLFCAASGTGKSTLAFNLFKKGYPLFSDDKCVLKWDYVLKKFTSIPSVRAVRLWQDAIDKLERPDDLQNGTEVIAKKDKYQFNLDDGMYDRIHMVNKIFVIRKVKDLDQITIRPLRPKEKIQAIRNQIHRPGLVIGEDIKKRHQKFVNNAARLIPIFFVRRPENVPVEKFVAFMQRFIGETPNWE